MAPHRHFAPSSRTSGTTAGIVCCVAGGCECACLALVFVVIVGPICIIAGASLWHKAGTDPRSRAIAAYVDAAAAWDGPGGGAAQWLSALGNGSVPLTVAPSGGGAAWSVELQVCAVCLVPPPSRSLCR